MESPELLEETLFEIFDKLPENRKISVAGRLSRLYKDEIRKEDILSRRVTSEELTHYIKEYNPKSFALLVMLYSDFNWSYDIFLFYKAVPTYDYEIIHRRGLDEEGIVGFPKIQTWDYRPLNDLLKKIRDELFIVDPQAHYRILQERAEKFNLNITNLEIVNYVLDSYLRTNKSIYQKDNDRWNSLWPECVGQTIGLKDEEDFDRIFEAIKDKLYQLI
jgi:hypothetical protein